MFTLAHLSDPHLAPLPRPRLVELVGKRVLGFLNWHRGRKRVHRTQALDDIVGDLRSRPADHIAVTGDLINLSLPAEYPRALAWLERLGGPHDVTLVPGNHDTYVRTARCWPAANWHAYMHGDDGGEDARFPFVRRRGPAALIGLSTAVPTGPLLATGRLGRKQIDDLARLLDRWRGLFRIVLIHHPPWSPPRRHFKRLTDAAALRAVLAAHGAELLLHGHDHRRSLIWLDGPLGGKIPAVGVPSASALAHDRTDGRARGHDDDAAWNLFRIDGGSGAWHCEMISRQRAADGSITEVERRVLLP